MPTKRLTLVSWLTLVSLLGAPCAAVHAQALIPHTLQLDATRLEQQGLILAQEASQLAQFQQYGLALQRAQLATQLVPKSPEIWALVGGLYIQEKRLDEGITALNRAKSLNARNSAVLFALGSAYFQKGNYLTAINYLQDGLKIKPNVPGALFDLGNAYLMLRQYDNAIAQYETAIAQEEKFWPAINNIGLIKYETGDANAAIKLWRQAVAIDEKAAEPMLAIAVALYAKGEREQGLALGESAIRLDSRYSDLKHLKENLWGDRLLADTKTLLETPRIQATIAQAQERKTQANPEP